MVWFWGSNSNDNNSNPKVDATQSNEISFEDPSLKEFYSNAKPPTPLSLASKEQIKSHDELIKDSIEPGTISNTPSRSERTATTYSHLGTGGVELKGGNRKLSLQQVARDNCVEFEVALSNCIVRGSIWDRFLSCRTQHMNQQKCTELQEYALTVLGYNQALSQQERRKIQDKADDLLIEYAPESRLTEEICENFKSAVDQHKSVTYRS